jgi:hypothetical protein
MAPPALEDAARASFDAPEYRILGCAPEAGRTRRPEGRASRPAPATYDKKGGPVAGSLRLTAVAALTAAAFLAAATTASAAFGPKLAATTDAAGDTTLTYSQAPSDDPVASLTFYVPPIYLSQLAAHAEGERLGTVTAKASAGGSTLDLAGTITQALATTNVTVAGSQVQVGTAATTCTGTATHGDYWVLNLASSGQTLTLPVYVDPILPGKPMSDFAGQSMTICLPAGTKLVEAVLRLDAMFTAPPGWNVWRMLATPYTAGAGTANTAGSVEAESQDRTPQEVSAVARLAPRTGGVAVSGQVKQGGKGVAGATVQVLAGKKVVATTKTTAGGLFRTQAPAAVRSVVVTASLPTRDLPACLTRAFAPLPCVHSTIGGFLVTSDPVTVKR